MKHDEFIRIRLPSTIKAEYVKAAADAGFTRTSDGEEVGDVSKYVRAVIEEDVDSSLRAVALTIDRERLAYWMHVLYAELPAAARLKHKGAAKALIEMNFGAPATPRANSFVDLGEPGRRARG